MSSGERFGDITSSSKTIILVAVQSGVDFLSYVSSAVWTSDIWDLAFEDAPYIYYHVALSSSFLGI